LTTYLLLFIIISDSHHGDTLIFSFVWKVQKSLHMVHCVSVHGGLGRTRVLSTKYNLKRAKSDDVLCSLFVIVVASVLGTYFYFMAPSLEIVRCRYLDCFVLRSYWYHAISVVGLFPWYSFLFVPINIKLLYLRLLCRWLAFSAFNQENLILNYLVLDENIQKGLTCQFQQPNIVEEYGQQMNKNFKSLWWVGWIQESNLKGHTNVPHSRLHWDVQLGSWVSTHLFQDK